MIGKNLHKKNPLATHTRIAETLVSYLGYSSENEIYGIRKILCEYAKVTSSRMIQGRIQHGWVYSNTQRTLIRNSLLDTYVWSSVSESHLRGLGFNNIFAIGSPWLYLLKIVKNLGWRINSIEEKENRKIDELWIYGSHSVTTQSDLDPNLLDFLNAASSSSAVSKKVMLYYVDFFSLDAVQKEQFQDLEIFTSLGSRLQSASSESHLFNVFHILNSTKKIVINVPTSALLYAISLNCEVQWFKSEGYWSSLENAKNLQDEALVSVLENASISQTELMRFAMTELGLNSIKSPEDLASILRIDNSKYGIMKRFVRFINYLMLLPVRIRTLRP